MKVVKVYGALRERLGQCRFEFAVETPAQAIKALCVNFPGLDKWIIDSEQNGIGYRVKIGKEQISEDRMEVFAMPWSEREVFSITPVVAGAGRGATSILLGGLLIGLSFVSFGATGLFAGGTGLGTSASTLVTAGSTIGMYAGAGSAALGVLGAGLVLQGIAQIISPMNPLGFESGKEAAKLNNMSFSGVVNTARQGLPVPIAYGRVFAGSVVISSGLDVDHSPNGSVYPSNILFDKIGGADTSDVFFENILKIGS